MIQINIQHVTAILIDRWYEVVPGSFDIDEQQFVESATGMPYPVGTYADTALGFTCKASESAKESGPLATIRSEYQMSGPLSSIRAVRTLPDTPGASS